MICRTLYRRRVGRGNLMSEKSDDYRERAVICLQRARHAREPDIKHQFEDLARGWLLLAEQSERVHTVRESID
jgi:hypothetical protein